MNQQRDDEIERLRYKLEQLEEERRQELVREIEKIKNPLKTIEDILQKKRRQIKENNYSRNIPLARFHDQEKLDMLEPIYNMLSTLQDRIEALEQKFSLS